MKCNGIPVDIVLRENGFQTDSGKMKLFKFHQETVLKSIIKAFEYQHFVGETIAGIDLFFQREAINPCEGT